LTFYKTIKIRIETRSNIDLSGTTDIVKPYLSDAQLGGIGYCSLVKLPLNLAG